MNGTKFLDSLEFISPELIEAADEPLIRQRVMWLKWGGLAACLCAITAVFTLKAPQGGPGGVIFPTGPSASPCVSAGPQESVGAPVDRPQERTSDTYSSLEELLGYLRFHDTHTSDQKGGASSRPKLTGKEGAGADSDWQTGRNVVSHEGTVYQIVKGDPLYNEKYVAIFHDGAETGRVELATPPEALYLSEGKLIVVGRRQNNMELDLDTEDAGTAVTVYDLSNPQKPVRTDVYHQRGAWAACWAANGKLWLVTLDGVCACGYSRLADLDDYKPQLVHNGEIIPWPEEDICVLGEPTQVKYAAVSCIDLEDSAALHKLACYGDISDVHFGADWFALVTQSATEGGRYSLQKVYTFDGGMSFTGKCDMAAAFGLEGTGKMVKDEAAPPEYPDVKAVTMADGTWRMVGEYVRNSEGKESKELFAMAYDPDGPRPITMEKLRLSAERFDIDDVLWEEDRAVISIGDFETGSLVFAEFGEADISFLTSGLICDRVQGVDGIYWYGMPLGYLRPFIPLGNGLYLRYNGTPDGLDLYDLSDSANPKCLYRSAGDIPEGARLDFDSCVINEKTVVVKLIPRTQAGSYYGPEEICAWAVFTVAPDTGTGVPVRMWDKQFPLIGTDPADFSFFEPSDDLQAAQGVGQS